MPAPKTPLLTVDCVVMDAAGHILVVRRRHAPFAGQLALPGGFVERGETVEDATRREVLEETGIKVRRLRLIGVYSDPLRDPREHTCSVAFLTHVRQATTLAGSDAAEATWIAPAQRKTLAFDHARIVADALRLADS